MFEDKDERTDENTEGLSDEMSQDAAEDVTGETIGTADADTVESTAWNAETAAEKAVESAAQDTGADATAKAMESATQDAAADDASKTEAQPNSVYRMTFSHQDQPGGSQQANTYQSGQASGTYQSSQASGTYQSGQANAAYQSGYQSQQSYQGGQGYQSQAGYGQQTSQNGYQNYQNGYQSQTGYGQTGYGQTGYGQQGYGQTGYGQQNYQNQQTYQAGRQQAGQGFSSQQSGPYSYATGTGTEGGGSTYQSTAKQPKKKKAKTARKRPYIKAVGCAVLCGVIVGACVIGSFAIGKNIGGTSESTPVELTTTDSKLAESTPSSDEAENTAATGEYTVAQIAENCGTSVVAITNKSVSEVQTMFGVFEQESEGSGSGVIIAQSDSELLIVTNNHVVEDADELTVCFNDSADAVYSAVIKGTDATNDLAVVAIPLSDIDEDVLDTISIAVIGNSDELKVGDEVVAVGNALGLGQSVTSGIISALDREVTIDDVTSNLLQTDAAINPGNSGGALFNMKGELVGINSAKYASEEVEGMGFAIPISTAEPVIENLMNRETRTKLDSNYGCLNITGTDVTSDVASAYNMPQGVYVSEVLEGGAADNAGIKAGDIITALDGISVSTISALKDDLTYYKAGETVDVTLSRNNGAGYEEMTVSVKLDNASQQDSSAFSSSDGSSDDDSDSYYYYFGDDGSDSGNGYGYYFSR